jgi:glycosyltransferase involved in cell wall biosynthesis
MVPQKGFDILLKAFALLKSNVQLRLGGDGPELNNYKMLARDLNIDKNITWLGQLNKEEALLEYQNCDAFVLASRHESMGVVFAEAMACGKPVIGTICGGPEEFIDDPIGYLVSIDDINSLQNAMENMMINHSRFDPGIIRSKFETRFCSRVVASGIRKVYDEVIGTHKVEN